MQAEYESLAIPICYYYHVGTAVLVVFRETADESRPSLFVDDDDVVVVVVEAPTRPAFDGYLAPTNPPPPPATSPIPSIRSIPPVP
mmetsp:Transcript_21012/g.51646  ORF Transcript_21012/g.51646 Transcript_21012/m.51646 type:complete len:86 (-) Transcript_21012:1613-1870(-)